MSEHPRELTYGDINIGDQADFAVAITEAMLEKFADVSGDHNPLHMDEAYASETSFHARVVHGMLIGAFFSRLVGMHLPGKYSLYISQTMRFHNPISIGETVTIRGTVSHKTDAAKTIAIKLSAHDAHAKILVSGEALVQLLQ